MSPSVRPLFVDIRGFVAANTIEWPTYGARVRKVEEGVAVVVREQGEKGEARQKEAAANRNWE